MTKPKPWDRGGKNRHAQGYGTSWDKLRKYVIDRDKGLCQHCLPKGRVRVGNQCDHIKPKAQGGTDDLDNLQLLCRPCHDRKSLRDRGYRVKPSTGADGWPIEDD